MYRLSSMAAIGVAGVAAIASTLLLMHQAVPVHADGSGGMSRCSSSQLLIRHMNKGLGAALGHSGLWYRMHVLRGGPCTLQGFPDVVLLDRNFHPVPPHVGRGGYIIAANLPKRRVVLSQRHDAYFALELADVPSDNQSCRLVPYLRVTPPGDHRSVVISDRISDCGTGIDVSPVEPSPVLR